MKETDVDNLLKETVLLDRIKKIKSIYRTLSLKQIKFAETFHVACSEHCGKCCEHFTPDITETEAEFLAYGLIVEGRDEEILKLIENNKTENYCPLYRKNNDFHCGVYKWRPLVCRLFGFAASDDKEGNPVFNNCKFNDIKCNVSTQLMKNHPESLVIMKDYGIMVMELNNNDPSTRMLQPALKDAIEKVRFMLELEEKENLD